MAVTAAVRVYALVFVSAAIAVGGGSAIVHWMTTEQQHVDASIATLDVARVAQWQWWADLPFYEPRGVCSNASTAGAANITRLVHPGGAPDAIAAHGVRANISYTARSHDFYGEQLTWGGRVLVSLHTIAQCAPLEYVYAAAGVVTDGSAPDLLFTYPPDNVACVSRLVPPDGYLTTVHVDAARVDIGADAVCTLVARAPAVFVTDPPVTCNDPEWPFAGCVPNALLALFPADTVCADADGSGGVDWRTECDAEALLEAGLLVAEGAEVALHTGTGATVGPATHVDIALTCADAADTADARSAGTGYAVNYTQTFAPVPTPTPTPAPTPTPPPGAGYYFLEGNVAGPGETHFDGMIDAPGAGPAFPAGAVAIDGIELITGVGFADAFVLIGGDPPPYPRFVAPNGYTLNGPSEARLTMQMAGYCDGPEENPCMAEWVIDAGTGPVPAGTTFEWPYPITPNPADPDHSYVEHVSLTMDIPNIAGVPTAGAGGRIVITASVDGLGAAAGATVAPTRTLRGRAAVDHLRRAARAAAPPPPPGRAAALRQPVAFPAGSSFAQLLTPSSRELKAGFRPLPAQWGMFAVRRMRPLQYAYRPRAAAAQRRPDPAAPAAGLVAEELQGVGGGIALTARNAEGDLSIDRGRIQIALVHALKTLDARVLALERQARAPSPAPAV